MLPAYKWYLGYLFPPKTESHGCSRCSDPELRMIHRLWNQKELILTLILMVKMKRTTMPCVGRDVEQPDWQYAIK